MSRKENEEPLSKLIDRMLKAYGLEDGYYAAAVVTHWETMMGPAVAKLTREIKLHKGKLTIVIDSASLRQDLSYAKEKIAERINREILPGLVKEVELR
jgi:predicted nucleic acid-binding Zn ribbon protein